MTGRTIRCAVYTRKSSEEGLDQTFNSIDAQREACEAYVLSQRHEGWKTLPTRYDDGGYSGGTLERPAVQHLLQDIRAGLVDLVVVYKIDRLTRSLADFAKMVEVFDAHEASFVSVTQHFNPTSSMGRLTLNVLLSFAQFEREVTGERIRDKIAASKKKGMWMGGTVPIGYDAIDRRLQVNPAEAEIIRSMFSMYLKTGNVRLLGEQMKKIGIRSKARVSKNGVVSGGVPLRRGAIYKVLKSRVYLGEIPHKDVWYPGNHDAIVDPAIFQKVQDALEASSDGRRKGIKAKESSLLAGMVKDSAGNRLIPSHAVKNGKRYRYYVSRPQKPEDTNDPAEWAPKTSVPANDLEKLVVQAIVHWLRNSPRMVTDLRLQSYQADERQTILRWAERHAEKLSQASPKEQREILIPVVMHVIVETQQVRIGLKRNAMLTSVGVREVFNPQADEFDEEFPSLAIAARMKRYGMETRLVINEEWASVEEPEADAGVLTSLARAHSWWTKLCGGEVHSLADIATVEGCTVNYVAKLMRGLLMAPDLIEGLVHGTLVGVKQKDLLQSRPRSWSEQRDDLAPNK